jgi:hypothetical protein
MRWRVIAGVTLTLLALTQMGVAGYMLNQTRNVETRVDQAWEKADQLCRQALSEVGNVTDRSNILEIRRTLALDEDWRVSLMNASSAISFCSTRQMIAFCMGKGCDAETRGADVSEALENQSTAPSREEILKSQPVRLSFRMIEVRP